MRAFCLPALLVGKPSLADTDLTRRLIPADVLNAVHVHHAPQVLRARQVQDLVRTGRNRRSDGNGGGGLIRRDEVVDDGHDGLSEVRQDETGRREAGLRVGGDGRRCVRVGSGSRRRRRFDRRSAGG